MSGLNDLIAKYIEAQQAWRDENAAGDDRPTSSPVWEAYEAAEAAVLRFPCSSIEDVRTKAAFVLDDANAFDTVKNCVDRVGDSQEPSLTAFLRSLMGEAP